MKVVVRIVWLSVYLVALFVGTHVPEDNLPFELPSEVLLHFSAYTVLTLLVVAVVVAVRRYRKSEEWTPSALRSTAIVLIVFGIAIFDELAQPFTGRSFEWSDLYVDFTGAIVTMVVVIVLSEATLAAFRRRPST